MPDPHLRLQPTIEHRKGRTILTHRWMAPEEGAERVWPLTKPAPPEGDTLRGARMGFDIEEAVQNTEAVLNDFIETLGDWDKSGKAAETLAALHLHTWARYPEAAPIYHRFTVMRYDQDDFTAAFFPTKAAILINPKPFEKAEALFKRVPYLPYYREDFLAPVVLHEYTHFYNMVRANAESGFIGEGIKRHPPSVMAWRKLVVPNLGADVKFDPRLVDIVHPTLGEALMGGPFADEALTPEGSMDYRMAPPNRGIAPEVIERIGNPDPAQNPFYRLPYVGFSTAEIPTVFTEYAVYQPAALYAFDEFFGTKVKEGLEEYWGIPIVGKPDGNDVERHLEYLHTGKFPWTEEEKEALRSVGLDLEGKNAP